MTTYREAIYMCLDLLKGMSDDFYYTEDHIAYLIDKCRALLLKQKYGNDPKKLIPYSNYQTIDITIDRTYKDKNIIKSSNSIPYLLQLGITRIVTDDLYYNYMFDFTSRERLPFVGNNKYTNNIVYCALDNDNKLLIQNKDYLWVNSNCEITFSLPLQIVGIFENPREVIAISENEILDSNIPIEESLVVPLIETVFKELAAAVIRPQDDVNNNSDDNADLQNYIARNMKSKFAKQLENDV